MKKVGIINTFVLDVYMRIFSRAKYKGVFKNMSKSTNKQQSQHLLTLMEANPDIASGFFKGGKEVLTRFWRKTEDELNSMGPPTKCVAEWKKVWADQKKYVRQKAAHNLKEKKTTGGGPNKEQKLSPTEEAIYNLIGMKSSVEGVSVRRYGCSPKESAVVEETQFASNVICDQVDTVDEVPESVQKKFGSSATIVPSSSRKKDDQAEMARCVLETELEIQRELLETIKIVALSQKEQEQTSRRMYKTLDKIYEQQKKYALKMEDLKVQQLEEIRRHNSFMEKQRVLEVEYKLEKNRIQMQQYSN